jgi:hypothetical protein
LNSAIGHHSPLKSSQLSNRGHRKPLRFYQPVNGSPGRNEKQVFSADPEIVVDVTDDIHLLPSLEAIPRAPTGCLSGFEVHRIKEVRQAGDDIWPGTISKFFHSPDSSYRNHGWVFGRST